MSAEFFYWTREWRDLRKKVLSEYGYRCMLCGSVDEIQVDHIQPRSKAPQLSVTYSNLQVLCKGCNFEKSNIHAEDYRDKAATEELDRETYLKALGIGL
ncbi:MAG: HNH endonuclease [Ketobacter sp.]|nr:HNH endonuclease [Ketobacter sp.]